MAFLAAAGPWLAAAGTAVTVLSAVQQGQAQKAAADAQATALRNQANADEAAAERSAIQTRRQGQYIMSRAQALAAASGAGATDPTVATVIGGIAGETEYDALTQLYTGQTQGGNARSAAQAATNEGKAAAQAGVWRAAGAALSGANTIYRNSRANTVLASAGTSLATKYG